MDILNLENLQLINLFEGNNYQELVHTKTSVRNIIKDYNGDIWLLSDTLYKIGFNENGEIDNLFKLPEKIQPTHLVAMKDVDEDGHIWAGYNNNVYKLYPAPNHSLRAVLVSKNLKFRDNSIITSFLTENNEVWIGTVYGLYRYYRNQDAVKIYELDSSDPTSLSHNYISDIIATKNNQLVIGTLKGLNIYNPLIDGFEHIVSENPIKGKGLNSNFISCIYYDGISIWCGTETGGVNKINSRELNINSFVHNENNPGSISKNPVNVILEDMDNNLWVGTVEGGLNRMKEGEDTFSHFTRTSSTKLCHNSVSALSVDDRDRLWVGTWGYGISLIDRKNPSKHSLMEINSGNCPDKTLDLVGGLFYDETNHGMWIGSNQGLYFYDLDDEQLITPSPIEIFANIRGIIGMTSDNQGNLWVGSQEGVYAINLNSRNNNRFNYQHYRFKLDDPKLALIEKITSIYFDSDNILWLGSDGFGFYKRLINSDGTYSFESYNSSDGLANNSVKGILEDDLGYLWISTNHGLSRFNKKDKSFINYYKDDGIENNHFYWNAYYKAKNGILWFGTLNGLIAINPAIVSQEPTDYKVTLTDFYLENEKVYPGEIIHKDISQMNIISLHEKYKSFSIDFSALNYSTTNKFSYVYRLLGYEDKWIELPQNIHTVSYMNLAPGNYTFQVKYVPKNSFGQGDLTELQIHVKPYFYKTTGFIVFIIILLISAFFLWYYRHIKSYEEQQKLLEKIVDDRTKELESQKEVLVRSKNELSQQNLILSQQNEKITRQKNQLIFLSRKVHKMDKDKVEFFTNISHEFRTPITLIMGPIDRALKLSSNPYVIEQLSCAERNSKYLLSLVNQLMDFQKIESKKVEITYVKENLVQFIESIINAFESQSEERKIKFLRRFSMKEPNIYFDNDSLHKVMINLLSNALKYTPNNESITIYLKSLRDLNNGEEKLYIAVKDSGTGIPEEDLKKVFKRFYQSSNHIRYSVNGQSGTGIGLYLCQQLIELLGGSIWVKNNRKKGCTFRILLPLHRSNPQSAKSITGEADHRDAHPVGQPIMNPEEWEKGRLTFLVVEDNPDMKNYICSILATHYNTLKADNGKEALTILDSHNVDFIISDLMMPEMDGIEFSKRVKENMATSHIPFLMLTAKISDTARLDSYRVGVDSYMTKPFDEEMLLTRITNILQSHRRYQQQFSEKMSTVVFEFDEDSKDKKFMDHVLEVMKSNYQNPSFTVSKFVEEMSVSKSLLNNKLNALSGKSPGQFISTYRLNVAYSQILQNKKTRNKNISDIAYDVGFNDPKYFSRCFSKQFNITPSKLMDE